MPIDVDIAVRELTDRAAITEVLHAYARLVDERDFAAVAEVFTNDCLAEYGVRETDTLHSSAAVVDWLTRQLADGTATSHHISNVQISFPDADHAENDGLSLCMAQATGRGSRPNHCGPLCRQLRAHPHWLAHRPPPNVRTRPGRISGWHFAAPFPPALTDT